MSKCKIFSKVLSANPSGGTQHLKDHVDNWKRKYLGGNDCMQSHL